MKKIYIILFLGNLLWIQNGFSQKFISEEVFIPSYDSLKLSGTLFLPKKNIEHLPLAIIIAGSGPTDRDGNNAMMTNNSLKYLAEGLTKNKIATFRYDKRAIGKSLSASIKEDNLRFEDYIKDAEAIIRHFKGDSRFSSITVVGHSEGSLIGMIASNMAEADKYVSISGVAKTADHILKEQLRLQFGSKTINPILDSLKQGYTVTDLGKLSSLFRPSVQPYMISWFKYDPQEEIARLSIPILILQGDNDIQVGVKEAELLKKAYPNAEYEVISKMNHILKIIDGDMNANLKSYYQEDIPVSKELIKLISKFILKK